MTRLMFIEGVSGVGKSTMVRALAGELRARGFRVKAYEEFDHTNPIDFYATAYFDARGYAETCSRFSEKAYLIRANTVRAGDAYLVRYRAGNAPVFDEPIMAYMAEREFCYKPKRLVPIARYTAAYAQVWHDFAAGLDDIWDVIIFDGSLLHHPINDMIRNYDIDAGGALGHVRALISALGDADRKIYYIRTDDIGRQLTKARADRGQSAPTEAQVAFWERRSGYDMHVLARLDEEYRAFDVSCGGWDEARQAIIEETEKERR